MTGNRDRAPDPATVLAATVKTTVLSYVIYDALTDCDLGLPAGRMVQVAERVAAAVSASAQEHTEGGRSEERHTPACVANIYLWGCDCSEGTAPRRSTQVNKMNKVNESERGWSALPR